MWIVCTGGDGICGIFRTREEAEKEYEKQKKFYEPEDEVYGDERVILAKIEKQVYVRDTGEKVIDYDEEGNEFECKDLTYWEYKEEVY